MGLFFFFFFVLELQIAYVSSRERWLACVFFFVVVVSGGTGIFLFVYFVSLVIFFSPSAGGPKSPCCF